LLTARHLQSIAGQALSEEDAEGERGGRKPSKSFSQDKKTFPENG
jgi:hypothetical protein